jgi:hypothetical protein
MDFNVSMISLPVIVVMFSSYRFFGPLDFFNWACILCGKTRAIGFVVKLINTLYLLIIGRIEQQRLLF